MRSSRSKSCSQSQKPSRRRSQSGNRSGRRRNKSDNTISSRRRVSFADADSVPASPRSPFLLPRLSLPQHKPTCVNPSPCTCTLTIEDPLCALNSLPSSPTTHAVPLTRIVSQEPRKSVVTWDKRNSWFQGQHSWPPSMSPDHTRMTIRVLYIALPLLVILAVALLMTEIGLTFRLVIEDILPPQVHSICIK